MNREGVPVGNYTAEQIKALRIAQGWTQRQLADMVGVSEMAVSMWERGKSHPSEVNVGKLVELFTNGGQPDRVQALEELISQLRDDHAALVSLVLRLAQDGENLRDEVLRLAATLAEGEVDGPRRFGTQAEQ